MTDNKTLSKQLFKKWQFWVAVVVILGIIGLFTQDKKAPDTATTNTATSNTSTQTTSTLPVISKTDYVNKEGLVVFKELVTKGYKVTAKYENESVPATNQDHTAQFTSASVTSCSDRLGWDAYTVSDIRQDGDNVTIVTTNTPNNNQTCPAGTTDDR